MNELSLEQKFKIAIYIKKIEGFNRNITKKYLITILKEMMIKDNLIKYFIKKSIN
uniref:Uncharacterized protein ycf18 n=1 Tax=Vertebrata thuyoides TaxID=2006970 RepID=A0A1Z1MB18_9FLOR|nr:phycobilisome degradation protein [Vertebrata thuyoides]ARW63072.1 phycobilisome degradation protein [Vertebrata thuyoides]